MSLFFKFHLALRLRNIINHCHQFIYSSWEIVRSVFFACIALPAVRCQSEVRNQENLGMITPGHHPAFHALYIPGKGGNFFLSRPF